MNLQILLLSTLIIVSSMHFAYCFTSQEVKCHVCKAVIQEMEDVVSKVDPKKKAVVSGFRLDSIGNAISKTVQLVKSELYLTELMEKICGKMDDYVKATYKTNGKFTLLKMIVDGKMNEESSNVEFVQDGDLNKSLEHFCLEILEDFEDVFLKGFQALTHDPNLDIKICTEEAKYCMDAPPQEDYDFYDDSRDEL